MIRILRALWGAITLRGWRERRAERVRKAQAELAAQQFQALVKRTVALLTNRPPRRPAPMDTIKLVNAESEPYQPTPAERELIFQQSKVHFEYPQESKIAGDLAAHNDKYQ